MSVGSGMDGTKSHNNLKHNKILIYMRSWRNGIRVRLRGVFSDECGFKSHRPHHNFINLIYMNVGSKYYDRYLLLFVFLYINWYLSAYTSCWDSSVDRVKIALFQRFYKVLGSFLCVFLCFQTRIKNCFFYSKFTSMPKVNEFCELVWALMLFNLLRVVTNNVLYYCWYWFCVI